MFEETIFLPQIFAKTACCRKNYAPKRLVLQAVLKKKKFGKFVYSHSCRFIDFSYSQFFQCYELVLSDVFEINLDDKQTDLLRLIIDNENFILAAKKDIDNFGINLV